jgi:hypothetical protein
MAAKGLGQEFVYSRWFGLQRVTRSGSRFLEVVDVVGSARVFFLLAPQAYEFNLKMPGL